jgi:mannose-6-phosphate isomerase-like protein (cupin superfamily)
MRLFRLALLTSLAALPAVAHAQEHDYVSADTLDEYASPDARPGRLFEGDNYWSVVAHREAGPGFSESHRDWTDIYFVTSGAATLIVGGTIPNPTEETPGEVRGTSIDGGTRRTLAEGDVVHIPPGTAHHVIVAQAQEITYLLLKVRADD